ncbi:MAG: ATP-binding cassette domain-containing protein [Spirosomataceae bacterium]
MEDNKLSINPYIRLLFLAGSLTGILLINKIELLLCFYFIVIVPLFVLNGQIKRLLNLLLFAFIPIYLSFILLYIVVLKEGNWQFIHLKILKLLMLTSAIQIMLSIPANQLISTFKKWGLKGETLITVLGAFTVWTDVSYRSEKIITARFARGFVGKRNRVNTAKQFPFVLVPLVVGILRTATERADSWTQKNIFQLIKGDKENRVSSSNVVRSFLTIISGNNFSGRSNYLKSVINSSESGVYIGEQPSSSITGIFPTVESEIKLHSNNTDSETLNLVNTLLRQYDFQKNYSKNPFTLSGGEQTILAVLSSILLQPKKIAIDCTLEQLNKAWREPLLIAIQKGNFSETEILLADNHINEYGLSNFNELFPQYRLQEHKHKFEKPYLSNDIETQIAPQSIELADVHFFYDKKQPIFKGANVELEPNNIYHLSGSNGTGKSTLAKILTGVLKIQSGKISINNKYCNPYKYPGEIVGYSFQNPDEQLFSTTIENEVLRHLKNETKEYKTRRETFLEMFGLQNIRKEHPAEMPFVIRKRIALAATLALDRSWYILDEPTLGQDNEFTDFLLKLLFKLKESGKGIIVISHSEWFTEVLPAKKLSLHNHKLTLI